MRELVKMFSDNATLDDIGIGQVRDSLSDRLAPATSTVRTRARYFLFIPWIYSAATEKWNGTQATSKARDQGRTLIETMKKAGHTKGLIGRVAGASVATLPSNIYGRLSLTSASANSDPAVVQLESPGRSGATHRKRVCKASTVARAEIETDTVRGWHVGSFQ